MNDAPGGASGDSPVDNDNQETSSPPEAPTAGQTSDRTDRAADSYEYCKIFPAIGIARVGNSPDEFFIGPEVPGLVPGNGSFKDPQGRVKRQAARFRVYAFDENDQVVAELHADHPTVNSLTWNVTVANRKAQWWQFAGTRQVGDILKGDLSVARRRNVDLRGDARNGLTIGPATVTLTGASQRSEAMTGSFLTWPDPVYLGEARTDEAGRLLVLGGRGAAASTLPDNPLGHYANNDRWFDDTSDGPVSVTVTLADGRSLPVHGRAWVIVAPPHFSPHTQNVVTGYDVMAEAAVEHGLDWPEAELGPRPTADDEVKFTRDIYPVLRRLSLYQWVSDRGRRGHAVGKEGDYFDEATLQILADPALAKEAQSLHRQIFGRLRTPLLHLPGLETRQPSDDELHPNSQAAINQANLSFMPPLAGDEGDLTHPIYDPGTNAFAPSTWFSLTVTQYRKFARWQDGDFVNDWDQSLPLPPPPPPSLDALAVSQQPAALTRASLEACQGGAFFPGIEFSSIVRFAETYSEAFRLADDLTAGDVTRWMALPWQADFYECRDHWWPTIRPDRVVPADEYERVVEKFPAEAGGGNVASLLVPRQPWARGIGMEIPPRPGLPTWPPPTEDAPEFASIQTAGDLMALCQRQLATFTRAYLSAVPAPNAGEPEGVYLRRLREFLDRSGLTSNLYALPPRTPEWDLAMYWNNADPQLTVEQRESLTILGSLRRLLREQTQIDDPEPSESIDRYAGRVGQQANNRVWQGLFDAEWRRRVRHRGKNDLVAQNPASNAEQMPNWSRLGFVVPRTAFGATVYVEGDRDRYELLPFREYFHFLLNLEQYPDFLPKARALADEYLRLAWELEPQLRSSGFLEEYGFFPYDTVTFRARLEKIYELQRRRAEAYNPATGDGEPLFRTASQVLERIRQLAPFNQLDGSWLEKIAQAGPTNEIQGYLFEIWSDEIGNGDPSQNHANIYGDLLHSAGIYLPPIASRAYADDPTIWDSSYVSPAYQSAVAQFPETYAAELLGMTLYLEWEAVYLPAMVKLYRYHGYNSLFYDLHVAIDNPVNGHGARARDAVARYLDHVREESGEREMQEHWRRIWNGYLAFAFVGGGDWRYNFTNPRTLEERVLEMFEQKGHYAQLNHGPRRLGPNALNDWFDEPDAFLQQLLQSDLIAPGDAKNSRIFTLLEFAGPMFKVFSAQDKELLTEYINSLPPAPLGTGLSSADAMVVLLTELAARTMAVPDHAGFELTGRYIEPSTGQEEEVTQAVTWWFQIGQPERLMEALANPLNGWIIPGNPAESRFVQELLSEPRRMSRFLIATVPEIGGRSAREVIIEWIQDGCPVPGADGGVRTTKAAPISRTRVRTDTPTVSPATDAPREPSSEPHADVLRARTMSAVSLTPEQLEGLTHRYYGPGGGACH